MKDLQIELSNGKTIYLTSELICDMKGMYPLDGIPELVKAFNLDEGMYNEAVQKIEEAISGFSSVW